MPVWIAVGQVDSVPLVGKGEGEGERVRVALLLVLRHVVVAVIPAARLRLRFSHSAYVCFGPKRRRFIRQIFLAVKRCQMIVITVPSRLSHNLNFHKINYTN